MFKLRNTLWVFIFCTGVSFADSEVDSKEKKKGYGYTLKKYFSGRKKIPSSSSYRNMVLYVGSSLYSDSTAKNFKSIPFSSVIAGFRQPIREVPQVGDFSLKTEIQNFRLKTDRVTQINITPLFSLPEAQSKFPVYVGLGIGFGFYPYFILAGKPALSLNGQLFAGLRLINLYKNLGLNGEVVLNMHVPFKERELYMETIANLGLLFSF